MYTSDDILNSLMNGQMSQAKSQFLKSHVSLADVYYRAMQTAIGELLCDKLLHMADSLIDRKENG